MAPPSPASAADCERDQGNHHPLEIFSVFRRVRPGAARDIAYTFIWNVFLGIVFWVMAAAISPRARGFEYFIWNQIVAQSIGYTIHGLFELGGLLRIDAWVRRSGWVAKTVYYSVVSTAGVLIGFGIVALVLDPALFTNWLKQPHMVITMAVVSIMISLVLSMVLLQRERRARVEIELAQERVRVERVEREAVLANLRALQAQIEPHFLFNTLANVTSLIDPDPAKAKHMLESFIRFLRASLAATRNESTTLAEEAELIASYLEVLRVRMGTRLRYSVDVPEELATFSLPPMLLQPLAENAIRHGLEPKVDGGEVNMRAWRDGAHVVVELADSGVGFAPTTRGGVGLSNLRQRLKLLFGERAALEVADAPGAGARVRVLLPA